MKSSSTRNGVMLAAILTLVVAYPALARTDQGGYFSITVVDGDTGRGVPLVELRTTNELRFYTDSGGIAAINEPGLIGRDVYFHVSSHGYEFPADGFGFRGKMLHVTKGGTAELKLSRINIAERLYRVTGEGIYRDSVLADHPVPLEQPLLNGQVTGQDSVVAMPYRDKIYWFWGDTSQASYPLGNFGASGATSEWPEPRGHGLDPGAGINLKYFVNESGFSRPMIPSEAVPGPGPKWLGGLTTVRDDHGNERLIAKYVRMKDLSETLERGLVAFDDRAESFQRLVQFNLDSPLYLDGHPFRVRWNDAEYLYCGYAVPYAVRVRAVMQDVMNPAAYEGFSPLAPGTHDDRGLPKLDRTADGRLNYAWKRDTAPLSYDRQEALIEAGLMKREEAWIAFEDVANGSRIRPHAGSIRWNEYRKRWIAIVQQSLGSSNLGEIWYLEADTPLGPWVYARKVVTHDKYSFYNPVHHPFFDQDGGRLIYFEGTYSDLFSGSPAKTPRYDYNQIMYRLSLNDPRLFLPVPVYQVRENRGVMRYQLRDRVEAQNAWDAIDRIAFFAMPPDRHPDDLMPIYERWDGSRYSLSNRPPPHDTAAQTVPLFYALPPDTPVAASPSIVPLYEYSDLHNVRQGKLIYSTNPKIPDDTLLRSVKPICRVWRNPAALPVFDRGVGPANTVAVTPGKD